jgi:hypothetical protein
MADKKKIVTPTRELKSKPPGGQVQASKHTEVYDKERKATFKFREPQSAKWNE